MLVVVPPVVMAALRRWSRSGVVPWLAGIALLVAWGAASVADMERADATGGSGSNSHGIGWLVAAVAVAGACVVLAARRPRSQLPAASAWSLDARRPVPPLLPATAAGPGPGRRHPDRAPTG